MILSDILETIISVRKQHPEIIRKQIEYQAYLDYKVWYTTTVLLDRNSISQGTECTGLQRTFL